MVSPSTDMLSVFITPCTNPTRIQPAIIFALVLQISRSISTAAVSIVRPCSAQIVGKSRWRVNLRRSARRSGSPRKL
eukprot:2532711-Rhodomonas_salina.1